ncbi:UDP-3-O-(3-hydroxymyristoyl)glucosamine N-acyltransferase [Arhodomonas aquaeolei]|uniref:UDP-3-O-(3-hydroxymyristoyl)glucosamine N-acyltransferase n=2 Tax=Ectothiorhodospiraceae TaxID=72276 RepID=UPI00037C5EA8|nr:UDP-3-O-(3-hydroxymyristoyl)glucosamine N-acyltransferase [Arhodomonas aquaeolei]MCS4505652.1 UDP-3-O-(3-hydroxymyristoyl)glucosamine N-acyltransferase [Arhodomonas aquaeolei]
MTLRELAEATGCGLRGDGDIRIDRVASLGNAGPGAIGFFTGDRHRDELADTRASAVILREDAAGLVSAALIADNPHLMFARAARLLHPERERPAGIHPQACVAPEAQVDASAHVAAGAVVEAGAVIGPRCVIAANAVVGAASVLGADCRIMSAAVIYPDCRLGDRVIVHGGAVIGADGFGFARDGERWEKVPQLGRVILGDDVEIGANSTVDRGALDDTVIAEGVKIDNLVQVAHNCHVGAHSVMAGCSAVAGSTHIGRGVTVAGGAGINGHLHIADGTVVMGMARVTHDIRNADVYASGTPMATAREWRRNAARFNQLDAMARRLRELERRLAASEPDERKDS